MQKILSGLRCLALLIIAFASPGLYAQTPRDLDAPLNSTIKRNYVRTWEPRMHIDDPAGVGDDYSASHVNQVTSYSDGFNRNFQTVQKAASVDQKDIVEFAIYDAFSRQKYDYLPFVSTSTGTDITNDGNIKLNAQQQQKLYMETKFPDEHFFYSQSRFENSPLNRVDKSFGAGDSWSGSEGTSNEKGIRTLYQTNATADDVQIWNIASVRGALPSRSGAYLPGKLAKAVAINENGLTSITYTDFSGRKIFQKTQLDANPANAYAGWISIYFVYDDFGNLKFVIPPAAVDWLKANNWSFSASGGSVVASELCYRYEFDEFGRIVIKKVPGAGETRTIYDAKSRPVFESDANMTARNEWLVNLYDNQDRKVLTGTLTCNITFATLQTQVNTQTATASESLVEQVKVDRNPLPAGYAFSLLTVEYFDNYDWLSETGSLFTNAVDPALISNYNYFIPYYTSGLQSEQIILNSGSAAIADQGQKTGKKVRVLGSNPVKFLYTVNFYDVKGKLIQVQSSNETGGKDVLTTQYNFAGEVVRILKQHELKGDNPQNYTLLTKFNFDNKGRLLSVAQKVDGVVNGQSVTSPEKVIFSQTHRDMGELASKVIGNNLTTNNYLYNIRGWLLGMNKNYLIGQQASGYGDNYFAYEIGYDKTATAAGSVSFSAPQFNGNLSGFIWKSKGDAVRRKYDYVYDNAERLGRANFIQNVDPSGTTWNINDANFSVHGESNNLITYDPNGNMLRMVQHGIVPGIADLTIDELQYEYNTTSNKLKRVTDLQNNKDSKLGDFKYDPATKTVTDYTYDPNGNMITDLNKGIKDDLLPGIDYNYLNKPEKIRLKGKGEIVFIYDAEGNKLRKIVTDNSVSGKTIVTTTRYQGEFIYSTKQTTPANTPDDNFKDKLAAIGHEEGQIRLIQAAGATPASFVYDYFIKDHLGSTRVVLTEEPQQDIYPAATLEGTITNAGDAAYIEKQFYKINEGNIALKSEATGIADYINKNGGSVATDPPVNNNPNSNAAANSQKLYKLQATSSGGASGLAFTAKVMSGDRVDIFGKSYYFNNNTTKDNYNLPVLDLLTNLLGAPGGATVGKGVTASGLNGQAGITGLINGFLLDPTRNNNGTDVTPKAYINWILFDEQFKYVSGAFSRVGAANIVKDHQESILRNIQVTKNGYLHVYVSNESPVRVFFDNLQVIHTRGPVLEETHYYPFGLTMAGISSKAAGTLKTAKKYNGKEFHSGEFEDGSGLDWYDYGAREYDPQINRFFRIDPVTDKLYSVSPYQYAENDPVKNIDLNGLAAANMNHVWASAGISMSGGQARFNNQSDLGKYYSGRQWVLDGVKSAFLLGSAFIEGAGLVRGVGGRASAAELASGANAAGRTAGAAVNAAAAQEARALGVAESVINSAGGVEARNSAVATANARAATANAEAAKAAQLQASKFEASRVALQTEIKNSTAVFKANVESAYNASKTGGFSVGNGGGKHVVPMSVVREIYPGEKIVNLIEKAMDRTLQYNVEHAIVRLGPNSEAPGVKVLVSGGRHGIYFNEGQITTIWGHTHPMVTGASDGDYLALIKLNQSKQYIFEYLSPSNPLIIYKPK